MGKEEAQEPFLPTSTPRPSEDLEEYVDETVLHKQKSDGGEYIPKKKGWRFLQLFILVLIITGVGFNLSHIGKSAIKGKSTNKDKIRRDAILEKSKNYEWDEVFSYLHIHLEAIL